MDRHEATFARIDSALKTLDARTDAYIKQVDERLQALGVTVETYLAEPVDAWRTADPPREVNLFLGYARHAGRWALALKTVRRLAKEAPGAAEAADVRVEPLRDVERAVRIAVVDTVPDVLKAVEAELERRSARIGASEPVGPSAPARERVPAAAPPKPQATVAPAQPALGVRPEVKEANKVEVLAAKPSGVPLAQATNVDVPLRSNDAPESVDHMFRLFGRKGR